MKSTKFVFSISRNHRNQRNHQIQVFEIIEIENAPIVEIIPVEMVPDIKPEVIDTIKFQPQILDTIKIKMGNEELSPADSAALKASEEIMGLLEGITIPENLFQDETIISVLGPQDQAKQVETKIVKIEKPQLGPATKLGVGTQVA